MSYFVIVRKDLPAWYELGLLGNGQLRISVERTCWDRVQNWPMLQGEVVPSRTSSASLALPTAIPPTAAMWGYGPVMTTDDRPGRPMVDLSCPWPHVLTPGQAQPTWESAYAVSATLNDLFAALLCFDRLSTAPRSQLLVIGGWSTGLGQYGCTLSAMLSRKMVQWLHALPDESGWAPVERAMRKAFRAMWAVRAPLGDFRVRLDHARGLHLECPGNACGLDPEDDHDQSVRDNGYCLEPHNTDSPLQQLTLLAGLAAVYDIARESLFP